MPTTTKTYHNHYHYPGRSEEVSFSQIIHPMTKLTFQNHRTIIDYSFEAQLITYPLFQSTSRSQTPFETLLDNGVLSACGIIRPSVAFQRRLHRIRSAMSEIVPKLGIQSLGAHPNNQEHGRCSRYRHGFLRGETHKIQDRSSDYEKDRFASLLEAYKS
jgi:hypothetical protein